MSKAEARPAEVPCDKCGASTYFEERQTKRACFKCGEVLDRSSQGARGLESSKEAAEAKFGSVKIGGFRPTSMFGW